MKFVDVILPLAIPRLLTYGIPFEWQGELKPGMRVEVQMGRNKQYAAIAFRIHDIKPESYSIKPIRSILDTEPLIPKYLLNFWTWVAQYYMCSLGEVMQAALPAHFKLMNESVLIWEEPEHTDDLSYEAEQAALALKRKGTLTLGELRQISGERNIAPILDELIVTGAASVHESLNERYKPKTEKRVKLSTAFCDEEILSEAMNAMSRSPKQLALLYAFLGMSKNNQDVSAAQLLENSQANSAQLKSLVEKGVFVVEEKIIDRIRPKEISELRNLSLDSQQSKALQEINSYWPEKKVVLLHGVTGSGKTMIFIELIREQLAAGKQVLLLLPEIGLSTTTAERLAAYFGPELGIYHSRFSDNERVEIWNKVKNKSYQVVAGPRSALWLPFHDLGMIIVDEEHEPSYKQAELSPRFQARDAAIYYAQQRNVPILLASATPSIESYHNAQLGKYGYVHLRERFGGVDLPEVEIVPARNFVPALSNIITKNLLEEIAKTLQAKKQVILFQNKRGYAPFLLCNSCGWVARCQNCDVSLTYHKSSDKMQCHYCGSKYQRVQQCGKCGLPKVSAKSFGTEKIEEEIHRVFPQVRSGRLDWDVAKGKNAYQQIIQEFEQGRLQILTGTQLLVKGLDFEKVGLVGVLSADSLLSFPDFRVHERAFQLLEQVAGRAGRREERGKVLIQAFQTEHPILQQVKGHDYEAFYQMEINTRKQYSYPPFARFIKVSVRHKLEKNAEKGIFALAEILKNFPHIHINGPAPAAVARIKNQYIFEIWVRAANNSKVLGDLKIFIQKSIEQVRSVRGMSNVFFVCDVDP